MIQLKSISAGYRRKTVIRDISLDIHPGEILVLLGPNGSGKSTLLKAALGLLKHTEGQILYDGQDIRTLSRKQIARNVSYLTQNRDTPSLQALKLVLHGRFPYLTYPRHYSPEDYRIAIDAMETAGCADLANQNVANLSGGQQQAVYLAMILAQNTETVFMDEPTTYLDMDHQNRILQTAVQLAAGGKAVVLVLHDLIACMSIAHRIAVLDQGNLVFCGTKPAFLTSDIPQKVFGVSLHCTDTPHGKQYYCIQKEK